MIASDRRPSVVFESNSEGGNIDASPPTLGSTARHDDAALSGERICRFSFYTGGNLRLEDQVAQSSVAVDAVAAVFRSAGQQPGSVFRYLVARFPILKAVQTAR